MKIRVRRHPSGKTAWELDYGMVDGRRKKESFAKESDADKALKAAEKLKDRHGAMGLRLTGSELASAVSAMDRLEAAGASLHEAVDFFVRKGLKVREPVEIADAVRRFLDEQMKAGKAQRSMETWRCSLLPFGAHFAGRKTHDIGGAGIEAWLRGNHWSARTMKNRLGDLRTFFSWSRRRGLTHDDPCKELRTPKGTEGEIGTLSLSQCAALLNEAARGLRPRRDSRTTSRLLGYVVLGMFCGLRRAEQERMTWDAVNVKEGTAIVTAQLAKTRRRRVVDISDNARAWLRLVKLKPTDRIVPWNFRELFSELRTLAKITSWPNNALRHTFASYHFAAHQNENLLAAQMGNSPTMVHRHYRALKTRAEARKFWGLRPGKRT